MGCGAVGGSWSHKARDFHEELRDHQVAAASYGWWLAGLVLFGWDIYISGLLAFLFGWAISGVGIFLVCLGYFWVGWDISGEIGLLKPRLIVVTRPAPWADPSTAAMAQPAAIGSIVTHCWFAGPSIPCRVDAGHVGAGRGAAAQLQTRFDEVRPLRPCSVGHALAMLSRRCSSRLAGT